MSSTLQFGSRSSGKKLISTPEAVHSVGRWRPLVSERSSAEACSRLERGDLERCAGACFKVNKTFRREREREGRGLGQGGGRPVSAAQRPPSATLQTREVSVAEHLDAFSKDQKPHHAIYHVFYLPFPSYQMHQILRTESLN